MPDEVEKELREQIEELHRENQELRGRLAKIGLAVVVADFLFKFAMAKLGFDPK